MRVRFLRAWLRGDQPTVEPGTVLDVDALVARALIADGKAVVVPSGETATLGPSTTAARTQRPEPRARAG